MNNHRRNLFIALGAGCLFLILASTRLGAQGLYFDELHQAISSFYFIGRIPHFPIFTSLTYHNIPIMNMTYSGAIKSAVFGLYMNIANQPFSVIGWRLVGILFVLCGIVVFGLLVSRFISTSGLVTFFFFLLTDITVLLTSRHDWGPTALALSIRLILLAVWLRGEFSVIVKPLNTALIAFLLGISLFEKLSSLVLILPVILMVTVNPKRRKRSHFLAAIFGALLGSGPLIFANLLSFSQNGIPISTMFIHDQTTHSLGAFLTYIYNFFTLGAGNQVRSFILGTSAGALAYCELAFFFIMLAGIFFYHFTSHLYNTTFRVILTTLLCYFIILMELFFLPQTTWAHHWVMATPFQYIAFALFIAEIVGEDHRLTRSSWYLGLSAIVLFVLVRGSGLVSLELSLARGDSSANWDPSLTQVAQIAGAKSNDAVFLAADWGVATQLVCFMNGDDRSLIVLDWTNNIPAIEASLKNTDKSELYVLIPEGLAYSYFPSEEIRQKSLDEIYQSLSPAWMAVPVEPMLVHLRTMQVFKFQKVR
jgi:hypothetical protein